MKKRSLFGIVVIFVGLSALWFLGVDESWFVEGCDDCLYQRYIMQYRVCGVSIYEKTRDHHTLPELIARDLGTPCSHSGFYRCLSHRWWGLWLCYPSLDGTLGLSTAEDMLWYEDVAAKVKAAGQADASLGEEFRRRVLCRYRRDSNYFRRFLRELHDEEEEEILLLGNSLTGDKLREITERIAKVEWLLLEHGAPQPDENAAVIIALGERAAPYLVEKIIDERPSQWLAWASVGDVAHMALSVIYNEDWPTREFEETHQLRADELYVDYHRKFLRTESVEENRRNRERLQDAWKKLVETRRNMTER